jgi:hypothetical protein
MYHMRATSTGDFLVQAPGVGFGLALISPTGELLRTWPNYPGRFELDGSDNVYVLRNGRVAIDPSIRIR